MGGIIEKRSDISYLVLPDGELGQLGELCKGRDVAYLIVVEVERSQVG